MELIEVYAIFGGRVQGVGFRATAQAFAAELGIKGIVSNLPNGTVELRAQASQEALNSLINQLKTYFCHSHLILLDFTKPTSHFSAFQVR